MAIFSKKTEVKAKAPKAVKTVAPVAGADKKVSSLPHASLASLLVRPRVTEKAGMEANRGVYTFEVAQNATKQTIAHAVRDMYKVTPVKVNIVPIRAKHVFVRGKAGVKSGGKKAYVYLKAGDKIDFA